MASVHVCTVVWDEQNGWMVKVSLPGPGTFPGHTRTGFVQKQLGQAPLAG